MLSKNARPVRVAALLLGLGAVAPAFALITCCEINKQRVCGDPPPPQCLSRPKTVFKKGVVHEIEAPPTAEQRIAREAAATRKIEEDKRADEQARRDRALLGSYTSERDIASARDRALAEIEKNATQASARLETALKRQKKLGQDGEFYLNKPLPAQLQAQIRDNDKEIAAQQKALQEKDAAIAAIQARFDADKERYRQITRSGAVPPAPTF